MILDIFGLDKTPDYIIGSMDDPFQFRWVINSDKSNPTKFLNCHLKSEIFGDMHDHPWNNISVILQGGYWEITPEGRFWRSPGDIIERTAYEFHKLELEKDIECWTLFHTGPRIKSWGFMTPSGYIDQDIYRREKRKERERNT